MPRLIFLGAPGAGKGTQAKAIAGLCQIPHISTGDILRSAISHQTSLGLEAKAYLDRGDLVPDSLVNDLVRERLAQPDAQMGWILDGFPRTVAQADFLDELLHKLDQSYDCAVDFEVPEEVLVSRMLGRKRKDDTEEVIRNRLAVYHEQTAPLIDFYQSRGKLVRMDGNQEMEEVTTDLKKLLK